MLTGMRRIFRARSRPPRGLLAFAMLAWAMLSFGPFAQPVTMDGTDMAMASMAMTSPSAMSTHCDEMSHHAAPSKPAQPMNGHGCCHGGGCYCSSSCAGIAGAPPSLAAWASARGPAIRPMHSEPGLTPTAPPLRPPIA
jgi:hypothetical protein